MHQFIPYGRAAISDEDIAEVVKVLKTDWLTTGPNVARFEQTVSDYCLARYAVATCNATAALHLACLALGVGDGDIVWTSPNTFLASANCALYCGAAIDFVDICPETFNLSVIALEQKLQQARAVGQLPKVVIPVHFAGQSCDMVHIKALADEYGFKIIEDASHAVGGRYKDSKIGSCAYSDITIFSFHPVKIVTTGEGGMALTNDPELADKMMQLRTHGMARDPSKVIGAFDGGWYYQQQMLGFNYRITDFQCALGISQFKRLDEFVAKRHQLVKRYHSLLQGLPVITPTVAKDNYSAFHLYVIQLDHNQTHVDRQVVFDQLRAQNVGVHVHYPLVHLQYYYREKFGFSRGDFPMAENYYRHALSLPMYPTMSEEDQSYVINCLTCILGA